MKYSDKPVSAYKRILISAAAGAVIAAVVAFVGLMKIVPLAFWDTTAVVYILWIWITIWPRNAKQTEKLAKREDPGKGLSDSLLTFAALFSLGAVGLIIVQGSNSNGSEKAFLAAFGVVSVVLSWLVIHTLYTLKYAELYYQGAEGGVDFNQKSPPQYTDFAYLSFTVGMTFQVSDTDLNTTEVRKAVLHQAQLSYLFGTIIIASTINLVVGLSH